MVIPHRWLELGLASALSSLLAWWSPVVRADPPADWTFYSFEEALKLAGQGHKRLFLYFGRHGCPTCDRTNREGFADARVIEKYNANYVLAYVDSEGGKRLRLPSGERITEMEIGVRLKVFGTPFFYFMEPNGSPVFRAPGYQSAEELLLLDRYVNGGHYKQQTFDEFKKDRS